MPEWLRLYMATSRVRVAPWMNPTTLRSMFEGSRPGSFAINSKPAVAGEAIARRAKTTKDRHGHLFGVFGEALTLLISIPQDSQYQGKTFPSNSPISEVVD